MGCFSISSKDVLRTKSKLDKVKSKNQDKSSSNEASSKMNDSDSEAPKQCLEISQFSFEDIQKATKSFASENMIGEGSFGRAYQGTLKNSQHLAFKITNGFGQNQAEFFEEISGLSQLVHPNITELRGFCCEGSNRVLVYNLAPYGSLHDVLHGKKGKPNSASEINLDWSQRMKIASGAALGIRFLHELQTSPLVVHRRIKSSNILLFEDFEAKVTDTNVGAQASEKLSRMISSGILGTFGYQAPEYVMTAQWTQKSDVYSFGIVLLELLTGRKPSCGKLSSQRQQSLVNWALPKLTADNVEQCVDPKLNGDYPLKSVAKFAALAALCLQSEAENRPNMNLISKSLKKLSESSKPLASEN